MSIKLDLSEAHNPRTTLGLPSLLEISILSQLADKIADDGCLQIRLPKGFCPDGLGTHLNKGAIYVEGDLGHATGTSMTGGCIFVHGNVESISNMRGGTIYVDGNIRSLINVHHDARICCTGSIEEYMLRGRIKPSTSVYCASAPKNKSSLPPSELDELPDDYHYLVQVNTSRRLPEPPSPTECSTKNLDALFQRLSRTKRRYEYPAESFR